MTKKKVYSFAVKNFSNTLNLLGVTVKFFLKKIFYEVLYFYLYCAYSMLYTVCTVLYTVYTVYCIQYIQYTVYSIYCA